MNNMNTYQQEIYNQKIELVKKLNSVSKNQFELITDTQDAERSSIKLIGDVPIYISIPNYQKRYQFYLSYDFKTLPYIKWDSQKRVTEQLAEEGITEPNQIGVLTANKIQDWIEYLTKVYTQLQILSAEKVQKVTLFLEEMRNIGATIKEETHEYSPNSGVYNGNLIKNGIEFEFTIHDEGYISKKTSIHYSVSSSVDDFIALSENKFKGKN